MSERPNVLYLHSHDSGRYIEPFGAPVASPCLQAFADDAVVFRRMYCASPACSPSRASLLTGQWPHSAGMLGLANFGFALEHLDHHLVHTLRQAGYESALAGLQHVHPDDAALGYDVVYDWESVPRVDSSERTAANAVAYLRAAHPQPFFLDVGFFDTHRGYPQPTAQDDPRWLAPPPGIPDLPETRRDAAAYQASLRKFDHAVGRILDELDDLGLTERTVIIVTTDHGLPWPGMKLSLRESGTGVMCMLRAPGPWRGGKVLDALASQVDIVPTICELVGLPIPAHVQGVSLVPLVQAEAVSVRAETFAEVNYHVGYEPQRSIRTDRWTYIRRYLDRDHELLAHTDRSPSRDVAQNAGWFARGYPREFLYDRLLDPTESENRIADPDCRDVLADLRARLHRWQTQTDDPLLKGDIPLPAGAFVEDVDSWPDPIDASILAAEG